MGQIKSALELALERTRDIEADKEGLEAQQLKESCMRLFGWLEKGEDEKVEKFFTDKDPVRKYSLLEGLMNVLVSRIGLPASEHSLDDIPVIKKALAVLFPGQQAVEVIPEQLKQFFESYLADRQRLIDALSERFEPQLREKEEQLARKTGQRVRLTPEMDPDFNKAYQANLDHMNEQYSQVIEKVRSELREKFAAAKP